MRPRAEAWARTSESSGRFYSYVNGTRVGRRFLVPSYSAIDEAAELRAYRTLQAAMPGVELVAIDADEMVTLGGAIHCITLGLSLPGGPRRCLSEDAASLAHSGSPAFEVLGDPDAW